MVSSKALDIVIPNAGSLEQQLVMQEMVLYAQSKNITLNILIQP